MNRERRTLPELRREGFRALVDRLGLADALRFIRQYDPGHGDYTQERHQWLDGVTLDDLLAGIDQRRAERGESSTEE